MKILPVYFFYKVSKYEIIQVTCFLFFVFFFEKQNLLFFHSQNSSQSSLDDSFDHTDGSGTRSLQDQLPRGGIFKALL